MNTLTVIIAVAVAIAAYSTGFVAGYKAGWNGFRSYAMRNMAGDDRRTIARMGER